MSNLALWSALGPRERLLEPLKKVLYKQRDVVLAFAQRRHPDGNGRSG